MRQVSGMLLRRGEPSRQAIRRFVSFTWGSGAGLLTDLSVFAALNAIGVPAVAANLCSTAAAITLVYALVTRHTFGAAATWRTYGAFFAWYAASALLVSLAIGALGGGDPAANLVWKGAFVPVTFVTNFLFSRWLFSPARSGRAAPRPRNGPRRPIRRSRPLGPRAERAVALVGDHPWIAGAVFAVLFSVFVLPMNDAISFSFPTDPFGLMRAHATRFAFVLCLWCLTRWAIRFGLGVLRGDRFYRRWLVAAAAHLIVLLPIFIAIYPGHWVQDEFDTFYGATHFFPMAWQGYLTHVYYQFCLFLLPSAVGIVVVQMAFICVVAGYVVTVLAQRLRRPRLAYLALLPLLSPAVLLNDFYPLRLTAYGYLLLLVVTHLLRRSSERRQPRLGEFFAVACGVAVLAFWRSEGLATLVLLPVAFVVLGVRSLAPTAPRRAVAITFAALAAVVFSGWLSITTTDPKYQLTAMINPLSTMVQGRLQGPDVARDLHAVDQVVSLNSLRSSPSYTETPAFFLGLRPDALAHTRTFRAAYLDLVVHNPGPFLENRWNAFQAANSQTSWVPQVNPRTINGSAPDIAAKFAAFEQSTPFGSAWDLTLKYQTARHLFLLDSTLAPTVWTRIVWNAIPAIAVVLLGLGIAVARRRWATTWCAVAVGGGAALVFLTEPAAYFMYFFPAYVCGLVAAGAAAALLVDRGLARRAARRVVQRDRGGDAGRTTDVPTGAAEEPALPALVP